MQFNFKTWIGDTVYTALEITNGDFLIFDSSKPISSGAYWDKEDVENNLNNGTWRRVEEKKQPSFSIKEGSIELAARFIVANNSYMQNRSVDYMIDSIKRVIKDMVDKIKNGGEAWYCGTAGYVVMIQQEDEDYYVIEVLVDPSVSQDREFVNVENII